MRRRPLLLAALLATVVPAAAQSASVTYQVGVDQGARRDAIGFSWLGGWGLGDNFVFVSVDDVFTRDGGLGSEGAAISTMYGEWHARLSMTGILGRRIAFGPVADVVATTELNFGGDGFLAHAVGVGVDWLLPAFSIARTSVYVRSAVTEPGATLQIFAAFFRPFRIRSVHLLAIGSLDAYGREGAADPHVGLHGTLYLDAGRLLGMGPGRARLGFGFGATGMFAPDAASWELSPQVAIKFSS